MEKVQGRFYLTIHTDDGGAAGIEYNDLETATRDAIFYNVTPVKVNGHKIVRVTLSGYKW